jgi:enoyl-CoA hydratase/carnithine racemase
MSAPGILYETRGGVARLTIDQPAKFNAMTFDMWLAMPELVARADADASVRVIEVTGEGPKAFCAGADISQFGDKRSDPDAVRAYENAVTAGMRALIDARKPSVAVIRGVCFGGGLALALCCDLRLCDGTARFRIPAARLGLGYAYTNIESLAHKIGVGPASDLLLSARIVDAREAERLGIANKCWPENFDTEAQAYLEAMASNAPLTLAAIKRAFVELARPYGERDKAAVDALVKACFESQDYKEGQAAFAAKRLPDFKGR